ncbi:MAG: hypothetical protein WC413_03580 [Candidatus Nanoarchaeia archaeon]
MPKRTDEFTKKLEEALGDPAFEVIIDFKNNPHHKDVVNFLKELAEYEKADKDIHFVVKYQHKPTYDSA